jgi:hypothetical protein
MSRGMAFVEIGKGELAREVQKLFLQAQDLTFRKGVKTSVKLAIHIYPPDPKDPDQDSGGISYETQLIQPSDKSRKFFTLLNERGMIEADGKNKNSILNLDFFEDDEPEFNEVSDEEQN